VFLFYNLAQMVNFTGTDGGWERARIRRGNKLCGAGGYSGVFSLDKDHANVSIVSATFGGHDSSKHWSEFTVELVHVFIGRLVIDLGDLESSEVSLISCLIPMFATDW